MTRTRIYTLLALLLIIGGATKVQTDLGALMAARVEVYDTNGRLIYSQALTENVTAINATD